MVFRTLTNQQATAADKQATATDEQSTPTDEQSTAAERPATTHHVCFICPYIYGYLKPGSQKTVGGAERQQHLIAQKLQTEGHRVSFITFAQEGADHERIDGFDVWKTLPETNDVRRTPAVVWRLLRSMRRVDADVFYVRGNPPLCILSSYCSTLLGARLVYCVANDSNIELTRLSDHHSMFEYTTPKLAYVDAVGRATSVIAQTTYQQQLLDETFDIESTVVPNAYTVPPADDLLAHSNRSFVLWVGSLDPAQKKPTRVVELARRLPAIEFVMIGWSPDDSFRAEISQQAERLPNLRFEGFVPPDEIDDYYRRAKMLVNTSEYEGFPNTFLEAWRFAAPVVSLHHTLDGVLADQQGGLHAGSMDRLATHVETLWEDTERAAELGHSGREYLETHYSLDAVFEHYRRIFEEARDSPDR